MNNKILLAIALTTSIFFWNTVSVSQNQAQLQHQLPIRAWAQHSILLHQCGELSLPFQKTWQQEKLDCSPS